MAKKSANEERVYKLEIRKPVQMLGAETPMVGDRAMTVGDMIVQMIPGLAASDNDKAVRIWRIGMAIDAGKDEFLPISELDFKLLKTLLSSGERPVWVKANLVAVFEDAEQRAGAALAD